MPSIILFLKGSIVGISNGVPGLSGGTIAFVLGIYKELITVLKVWDRRAIDLMLRGKWGLLVQHLRLSWTIPFITGVSIGIIAFAHMVEPLLARWAAFVFALFWGLILSSAYTMGKQIVPLGFSQVAVIALGLIFVWWLPQWQWSPNETRELSWLILCGVGVITSASMLLPGLSGSLVLLTLGYYATILKAVSELEMSILIPFGGGMLLGLFAFVRLIAWLLERYRVLTLSLMLGFILGSLRTLWPWTASVEDQMLMPLGLGNSFIAIGLMILGGVIGWLIEQMSL